MELSVPEPRGDRAAARPTSRKEPPLEKGNEKNCRDRRPRRSVLSSVKHSYHFMLCFFSDRRGRRSLQTIPHRFHGARLRTRTPRGKTIINRFLTLSVSLRYPLHKGAFRANRDSPLRYICSFCYFLVRIFLLRQPLPVVAPSSYSSHKYLHILLKLDIFLCYNIMTKYFK